MRVGTGGGGKKKKKAPYTYSPCEMRNRWERCFFFLKKIKNNLKLFFSFLVN